MDWGFPQLVDGLLAMGLYLSNEVCGQKESDRFGCCRSPCVEWKEVRGNLADSNADGHVSERRCIHAIVRVG